MWLCKSIELDLNMYLTREIVANKPTSKAPLLKRVNIYIKTLRCPCVYFAGLKAFLLALSITKKGFIKQTKARGV